MAEFSLNPPVIKRLLRHQCDHMNIVNVLEKQPIMLIFSAQSLNKNNALFGNGSTLFYLYMFSRNSIHDVSGQNRDDVAVENAMDSKFGHDM